VVPLARCGRLAARADASAMVSVCVCCLVFVTAVRASRRDRTLVLKQISIEVEVSTWSSF